eukprot:evm.model.scf_2423.1 EVM.evm.TU.scf_2423.1   scf_2423:3504-6382(-)
MLPESDPSHHVHIFYDDTPDGYIDRSEFEDGMARLGLSNASDSLDLNGDQWEALMDHVFSFSNPDAAVQMLPYAAFQEQIEKLAPMFTTLYDSAAKEDCMAGCAGDAWTCQEWCSWHCGNGAIGVTEATFGLCDESQGCHPACGHPDNPITGYRERAGELDFHVYDSDPPDGVITIEEFRQALLKLYGNCTYVIEPNERDYQTCVFVGRGQFDLLGPTEVRRHCK